VKNRTKKIMLSLSALETVENQVACVRSHHSFSAPARGHNLCWRHAASFAISTRMRVFLPGLAILLAAAAQAANRVPAAVQQVVMAYLEPSLVLPATALWTFDSAAPFPLGGTLVCGHVNYQISTRRYVGPSPFYAIVSDDHVREWGLVTPSTSSDPTGAIRLNYQEHCGHL